MVWKVLYRRFVYPAVPAGPLAGDPSGFSEWADRSGNGDHVFDPVSVHTGIPKDDQIMG